MDDGDELRAVAQQPVEFVQAQLAAFVDGHDAERRAGLLAHELPRHDIRVMLHPRDQHLIAGLEHRPAPGLGDEIDALGAALRQHDFPAVRGVDEVLEQRARPFVRTRSALAQEVRGPVDVGVVVGVVIVQGIEDRLRLLRRVGAVEIDERPPMNLLLEDWEIGADAFHIEARTNRNRQLAHEPILNLSNLLNQLNLPNF